MLDIVGTVADFVLGLGVGLLAGMLGLGGGIVSVPALTLLANVSQHAAQGVSLVAIVPTAVVGALAHRREGNLAPGIAISVGIVLGRRGRSWGLAIGAARRGHPAPRVRSL